MGLLLVALVARGAGEGEGGRGVGEGGSGDGGRGRRDVFCQDCGGRCVETKVAKPMQVRHREVKP